jgi:Na+/melibiose symporter-like transporter
MEKRSNRTLAAFVGPCLPYAALGLPLAVTLPYFYSTYIGLSLELTGAALLAVRGIDFVFDPLIGWAMDRTRNRWGPYRTWITAGTPLLIVATWLIFMARPGVGVVYFFNALIVLYAGFSVCTLAQLAWAAVLSSDYDQRSRIYGWWQAANILGVLIALLIPAGVMQLKLGDFADGVRAMGGFILIALPVSLLINLWAVPEPRPKAAPPTGGLGAYFQLFRRRAVRQLLTCDLMLGLAPGITGALLFFYFKAVKGFSESQCQLFMICYFIAGLIGAPFWSWLATRLGKHQALQVASLSYAGLYLCVGLLPPGNFPVTAAGLFVAGLPYAAGLLLCRAMMADIGDEVRLETGVDRMGLLFSFLSLSTKLGFALSGGSLVLLGLAGFSQSSGAHNSDQALWMLQGLFLGVPVLILLIAAVVLRGYPLGPVRHGEIRAALAARDAKN